MPSEITSDILQKVTAMGKLCYAPEEAGKALGIGSEDMAVFMEDEEHPVYKAYWAGFYETDIQLRNSILKLAVAGSGPAQTMMKKIIDNAEIRRGL